MIDLGTIENVPLREVFKNEQYGFSKWLSENISVLGNLLGLEISNPQTEKRLTTMRVDIVASVGKNEEQTLIVENQLEDSDSEHLGKLITYAACERADYAVWIVKRAREEHRRAIELLNSSNDIACHFFLIEVSLMSIDNSKPAINFEVVASPEEYGQMGEDEMTSGQRKLYNFWEQFLPHINSNRKPQPQNDMEFGIEVPTAHITIYVNKEQSFVKFTFWHKDTEVNNANFDRVQAHQAEIEKEFGAPLSWQRRDNLKGSLIVYALPRELGGYEQLDYTKLNARLAASFKKMSEIMPKYARYMKKEVK